MNRKHKLAIVVATGALAAAGTGVAVGAAAGDDAKQDENAILADAAKRLDTTTEELRDALSAAVDARLDQAVQDGRLTQEQADAIRRHREESGSVLGFGGGPHGPGPHVEVIRGAGPLSAVAKALGIGERQLFRRLHAGDTLTEIAEAEGKTIEAVKAAAKTAAEKDLAKAVDAGKLTREQADDMLEHLDDHLDDLAEHGLPAGPRFHHRGGPPPFPPGHDERGARRKGDFVLPAPAPARPGTHEDGAVMPAPAPAFGA